MARRTNYGFERRERERLKTEKRRKRLEAKSEKAEQTKIEKSGLPAGTGEAGEESEVSGDD